MPDLFVDIETVPDFSAGQYREVRRRVGSGDLSRSSGDRDLFWKFKRGGLNPFEGKVILITYRVDHAHVFRLKEWELGEAAALRKFYEVMSDLQRGPGEDNLRVVGHNILNFDLFFLYHRMLHHKIDDPKRLHRRIMSGPETVDLLQTHLPLNNHRFRGLKHDVLAYAYGFRPKLTLGPEEIPHYFEGEYDKILEYSEREFIYPDLFEKILSGGLVSGEGLRRSIERYNEASGSGPAGPG